MHKFGVNYNDEKDIYKRGSILVRQWNGREFNRGRESRRFLTGFS